MNTAVIKYQNPKGTNQKGKQFFLISLIKSLLYFIFKILTFWIPKASPDYEGQLDNIEFWYIEIEMESGIPQREIGFDIWNRAKLFGPTERNYGFWTDSNTVFDIYQFPSIDTEVFNDIFESLEEHNMDCVRQKIEKYLLKWIDNNSFETPELPLLIYNLTNYNEMFDFDTWKLLSNSDLTGYEWDSSKRVIDAKGNDYRTAYINFGHPIGCVYPEKIEETISLDNFINLLRTNFKKVTDKELNGKTFEELFAEWK